MYSGARIEEIFSLRVENVNLEAGSFEIAGAKSAAGNRVVPISSRLAATMARLVSANRPDGFLLPGKANKYLDRAGAIGKRFSRLKKDMRFDGRFVFHSVRRTVASLLEQAGVAENIAADILGHEKAATLSYGLYSGGTSLEQRRAAIEKLTY